MHRFTILLVVLATANARNIHNRILNGLETTIEEHPYQASVQYMENTHFCGGCIVTPNRVLTASHCFNAVDYVISHHIRAGSTQHLSGGTVHKVESFITHPQFNRSILEFDVAVVLLRDPIVVSNLVLPIPIVPIEDGPPKAGEMLDVTGWGYLVPKDKDLSSTLRVAHVAAVNFTYCQSLYSDAKFQLSSRVFCAGGGDQGPFGGDSGGPIINAKRQVVGLVSWGYNGGSGGYPAVYTDLSNKEIRSFVNENIA